MPKIHLHSDIHLDFGDCYLPGGKDDILILAGDICEATELAKQRYDHNNLVNDVGGFKRSDRMARFFAEECAKYRQVIYIMGNHESYGGSFHKTYGLLQAFLPDNVHLLEKESIEIDGVIFLCGTMWTDFNKQDSLTLLHLRQRMSDYKHITMHDSGKDVWHRLTPQKILDEHYKTKAYFKYVLEENRQTGANKPVVVVSHHAPSHLSIDPMYANDTIMNGAYYSDLSDMILDNPEIKVWCHGHVHLRHDYQIGDTRVLCNPRGYYGYETIANQLNDCIFEI